MSDVVYINFEEGVKRVMNNSAFYIKMLKKYKEDKNLKDIDEAIKDGDMEKAKIAAHTLKGLAGNLSLTELYKESQKLEKQIKDGELDIEQFEIVKKINEQTLIEVEKVVTENEG